MTANRSAVAGSAALAAAILGALSFGCGEPARPTEPQEPVALSPGPETPAGPGVTRTLLGYQAEVNARVASLDLDRDGRQEIAVASSLGVAVIRVFDQGAAAVVWQAPAHGGATALASGDVDGDGIDDLVVGWGMHREKLDAPARLVAYRTRGAPVDTLIEEEVAVPTTSRAQFSSISVTALEPDAGAGILYGHFASKYEVRAVFASRDEAGTWRERELFVTRMGSELAAGRFPPEAASPLLFVGRPYGDELKSPGDVYALGPGPGGERIPLPSVRGVRSLAVVDLGSIAEPIRRVCYGDGWHWKYKAEGRGLITCVGRRPGEDIFRSDAVVETAEYSISALAAADLDGDGKRELVAAGGKRIYVLVPSQAEDGSLRWHWRPRGPGAYDLAVVDVDGDGRDEIALAGEEPALLRFSD